MARRTFVSFFALFVFATLANAQDEGGWPHMDSLARVDGVVTDFEGNPWVGQPVCLAAGEERYCTKTDKDGKFVILPPNGRTYTVQFVYLGLEEDYGTLEAPSGYGVGASLALKYRPAQTFRLRGVFFETGSADLSPASFAKLDEVAAALLSEPKARLEIGGHTDGVGSEEENLRLSQARAESVMAYLVGKGVDASRLTAKGYGESQPVASNDTPEGRQQNRRTEVKIVSSP